MTDVPFIPVVTRSRVTEGEGPPRLKLGRRELYFDVINNDLYVGTANGPALVGGPRLVLEQGVLKRRVEKFGVDLTTATDVLRAEFEEQITTVVDAAEALAERVTSLDTEFSGKDTATNARIDEETEARSTALAAEALARQQLDTKFSGKDTATNARIDTEALARSDGDAAEAALRQALDTKFTDKDTATNARVTDEIKARSDAIAAEAARLTLIEARSKAAPNLIENGGFTQPLDGLWFLEGGPGPTREYDGQIGDYLALGGGGQYVVSKEYPCGPGYTLSASWSGSAASADANIYLQALPSYALLARAWRGQNGWDFRKRSDGSTAAAPAGTTAFRVVVDPAGAAMHVSRIKVNFGSAATDWSDDRTMRATAARLAAEELARSTADSAMALRQDATEASLETEYLTANPTFNAYPNGAVGSAPALWRFWSPPRDTQRWEGRFGRYAVWQHNNQLGTAENSGLTQSHDDPGSPGLKRIPPGEYIIEADFKFETGNNLNGSGVFFYTHPLDGTADETFQLRFDSDPDIRGVIVGAGVVGQTYSYRKTITVKKEGRGVFHLMTSWDGHGAHSPKVLIWQRCGLRLAGAADAAVKVLSKSVVERGAGGGNLLGNAVLSSTSGWTISVPYEGPIRRASCNVNEPDQNWNPYADNVLAMATDGRDAAHYADWYSDPFAIEPGTWLEFGAQFATHRSYGEVYLQMTTVNGDSTFPWALAPDGTRYALGNWSGGKNLNSYAQFWGKALVPANCVFGRLILRKGPTDVGQPDSWAWWTRPFVRQIPADQTKPSPFDYGFPRYQMSATWRVGAGIPGAEASITAEATNASGRPTSRVVISAMYFAVWNPVDGVLKKALEVVNGNVLLTGGLQAGAFIRLGNGNGWPVALKAVDFNLTDGEAVNFGTDLGALPSLTFALNNLAPLNSGETYNVYAEGLTATGFTMRAKINVPASSSAQSTAAPGYSEVVNSTGNNGRTLYLENKPFSSDGVYRLQAIGYQEHRFPGQYTGQAQIPDGESLDYVGTTLGVWAYNGSWVKVATVFMDTTVDPYLYPQGQFHTTTAQWFLDQTFQLPGNVSHVNVTRESASNGRTGGVTSLGPVSWQAQGAGSGIRSATPGGQKTKVTVRPQ